MNQRTLFAKECLQHFRNRAPPTGHTQKLTKLKKNLMTELKSALKNDAAVTEVPGGAVKAINLVSYGSYATGFCTRHSDVDLSLDILSVSDGNPFLKGIPQVEDELNERMWSVASHLATTGSAKFGGPSLKMVESETPVVSFVDNHGTKLSVDIVGSNYAAVANSSILSPLVNVQPELITLFVNTVKDWAKAREVVAPVVGMMNSYSMTVMCLNFLVEIGLLPPMYSLSQEGDDGGKASGFGGTLAGEDVEALCETWEVPACWRDMEDDDDKLCEALNFLMYHFALYYQRFDWKNGCVSLTHPRMTRTAFAERSKTYLEAHQAETKKNWKEYFSSKAGIEDFMKDFDAAQNFETQRQDQVSRKISAGAFVVEDSTNFDNCCRQVNKKDRVPVIYEEFDRLAQLLSKQESTVYSDVFERRSTFKRDYVDETKDPRNIFFNDDGTEKAKVSK